MRSSVYQHGTIASCYLHLFHNPTKTWSNKTQQAAFKPVSPLADDNHQACALTQSTLGHHASFSIEAIEVNLLGTNFVELEKSAILLTKV
jgi:hypothetical protein